MRISIIRLMLTLIITTSTLTFFEHGIHSSDPFWTASSSGLIFPEQQIVALVNGSRAYDYDLELERIAMSCHAFRSGGSLGADDAAQWIKGQFESFGLQTWLETFNFTTWNLLSKPSLVIDDDGNSNTTNDQISIDSFLATQLSKPTSMGGVFADLVVLPLPPAANINEVGYNPINMTEWNAVNTAGKIVVIGKEVRWSYLWSQAFETKLSQQPPAAIAFTWWYDWMSFTPYMQGSSEGKSYWSRNLSVGSVDYEDGLWIRNREKTMNVSARLSIEAVFGTGPHYNVVGKIAGYENPEKMVIVSSHYDTVMSGGFCDNGAGTAGVLEVAKVITDAIRTGFYLPKYTLLFVAFADEELYLVGSINYVILHKNEMSNVIAVVNLDCIGSDDLHVTETDPESGFDLDQVVLAAAQDLNVTAFADPGVGTSDHETFRSPAWANNKYSSYWGLTAGIADATPVKSSATLESWPILYSDMWSMGRPGWIHTSNDNSTSTEALNWVEVDDLEDQLKVAVLTVTRTSPNITILGGIAALNVAPSKTAVGQEYSMNISVTLLNLENHTESFNVTFYLDTVPIAVANVTLNGGNTVVLTVTWNATGIATGNYTISAYASPLPDEANTSDNLFTDGRVHVGIVGDINGDDKVDMKDVGPAARAFDSTPGNPAWNSNADINNDGRVNMMDIGIACRNFGQHYP